MRRRLLEAGPRRRAVAQSLARQPDEVVLLAGAVVAVRPADLEILGVKERGLVGRAGARVVLGAEQAVAAGEARVDVHAVDLVGAFPVVEAPRRQDGQGLVLGAVSDEQGEHARHGIVAPRDRLGVRAQEREPFLDGGARRLEDAVQLEVPARVAGIPVSYTHLTLPTIYPV